MIFVESYGTGYFSVAFKPVGDNLSRIRELQGAQFDGKKLWTVPMTEFNRFEELFFGEVIYKTPRHILTGQPPPPPPKHYSRIPDKPIPDITLPLYDYQKFGANYLAYVGKATGHAFLTDKVGTGKTPTSIAAGKILEAEGKVENVLVFCKASLKYQWLRDGVEKFTNDEGIVIDGTKKQRDKLYAEAKDTKYRYIIVNYELLLHDYDLLEELIIEKDINLILADEAHRIVNHKGKMNNALRKLVRVRKRPKYKGVPYIFYMTATPLSSKVEQLYGIFSIRDPEHFGKFTGFSREYLKYGQGYRGQELVGYRNLHKLKPKVSPWMLRRTDKEIDMELPEMIDLNTKVKLTPLQRQLDDLALTELETLSNQLKVVKDEEQIEMISNMIKAMMYVRKAIADTPELLSMSNSKMIQEKFGEKAAAHKDGKKSAKLDELKDLIDEMVVEGGEKLVIFSELETMVRILEREVKALGIDCVTYTGKIDSKEKDKRIQEFKDNPGCRILIATDAAAEGLNLQFARYMVNYDMPWNPDKWIQRLGRIQRGGSEFTSVKNINLIAEKSIDEAIYESLMNKQNLFNFFVENTDVESEALKKAMYKT